MSTGARTYLDHNATSPLRREARAAMLSAMEVCGNPSSVHAEGRSARTVVECAREQVAALVNAKPSEVVFTSGATEANNWVIAGGGWRQIVTAAQEHPSVLEPARRSGAAVVELPSDPDGDIDTAPFHGDPPEFQPGERCLVSLQWANSETGVLQDEPLMLAPQAAWRHTDAAQAVGRVKLDFAHGCFGYHFLSLSSHKIGGPAGVGALVVRDGVTLPNLMAGGGQERRRRAGTENVVGIAGFGAAAEAAGRGLDDMNTRVRALRDDLERRIRKLTPDAEIFGAKVDRLPNTTLVAVPGMTSELLLMKLDLAGIAVSAGSACSSGKVGESHVLAAMGVPARIARGAIRISLGWSTCQADIDTFIETWAKVTAPRNAHGRVIGAEALRS